MSICLSLSLPPPPPPPGKTAQQALGSANFTCLAYAISILLRLLLPCILTGSTAKLYKRKKNTVRYCGGQLGWTNKNLKLNGLDLFLTSASGWKSVVSWFMPRNVLRIFCFSLSHSFSIHSQCLLSDSSKVWWHRSWVN